MNRGETVHSSRVVLFRELDALLDSGFTGNIELHCLQGQVLKYTVSETRKPGERRVGERRQQKEEER